MKAHRMFIDAGLALFLIVLAGCATQPEGPYPYSEGWRRGTVEELVGGASFRHPTWWKCLKDVPAEERERSTYAWVVTHQMLRHPRYLVPVPRAMDLQPGQRVYLNVRLCENAVVLRQP